MSNLQSTAAEKVVLPHHTQAALCTTRLPYRQGRELTAVKVYTVNNESAHLLIFGVPALKLRQELKLLFSKFGKLKSFTVSADHESEVFAETYHAVYDRVQSARFAKRMMDTKNFYGGALHVCYAPELENLAETKHKLLQRQRDIYVRLNGHLAPDIKESDQDDSPASTSTVPDHQSLPVDIGPQVLPGQTMRDVYNSVVADKRKNDNRKRKYTPIQVVESHKKEYSPCFVNERHKSPDCKKKSFYNVIESLQDVERVVEKSLEENEKKAEGTGEDSQVETVEGSGLNFDKFGGEIVRKLPDRPCNKIKFFVKNKS